MSRKHQSSNKKATGKQQNESTGQGQMNESTRQDEVSEEGDKKKDTKKEKVLHTRISETLEDEIKTRASNLGVSASNLVRNVLLNTFGLVEDIVADSANIAKSARGEAIRPAAGHARERMTPGEETSSSSGRVWAWHGAVLNLNAVCDQCNTILPQGSQAVIGVIEGSRRPPIICFTCLKELTHEPETEPDSE